MSEWFWAPTALTDTSSCFYAVVIFSDIQITINYLLALTSEIMEESKDLRLEKR